MKDKKGKIIHSDRDELIERLISEMTLREKLGQLNMVETVSSDKELSLKEQIRSGEIGSMLMSVGQTAGNTPQGKISVEFYNELQRIAVEESRLGIPLLFGRDVIHGHKTVYPIPLAMASSFNFGLIEECFREIAEEASVDSVHLTFAPMLDLSRDPRWGRIVEGCGEDPLLGVNMARSVVRGFQGDNNCVITCAKHYIGYGAAEGGRDYWHSEISDYGLYNYYLPQFRAAFESGAKTVMSSFNDVNGEPISGSRYYLTDILRKKLGFDGAVISDYAAIEELVGNGVAENREDAARIALSAGVDIDMWDRCYIQYGEAAVESGRLDIETVNDAVRRVLRLKLEKGLFDKPYCQKQEVDYAAHRRSARKLALESMVLLKNENGALPLSGDEKLLLVGKAARSRIDLHGSWSLDGDPSKVQSLFEVLSVSDKLIYDENCESLTTDAEAVIIAFGEPRNHTGECASLSDISISAEEKELLKKAKALGKKTIGVFFYGRPIAMEGIADELDALLYAWQCGDETAPAAFDILFGKVSPSGRLTATFPRRATHLPLYYNGYSSGHDVNSYYGQYARCCYIDGIASPYYPFGYGLSYADFSYGDIICDKKVLSIDELDSGEGFRLSVTVKNTGKMAAAETVQLYIHDKVAKISRPLRELKAFDKKVIEAGDEKVFTFFIGEKELGYFDKNGDYMTEAGEFDIYIGENCQTDRRITVCVTD